MSDTCTMQAVRTGAVAMVLALAAGVAFGTFGSIQNIPTDSPIYDDIDLLKTSGLIRSMVPQCRPWTRGEAIVLVAEADSLSHSRGLSLSQQAALDRLMTEFAAELPEGHVGRFRWRPVLDYLDESVEKHVRLGFNLRGQADAIGQRFSLGGVLTNLPDDRFAVYDRADVIVYRPDSFYEFVNDSAGWHVVGSRAVRSQDGWLLEMGHAYLAFRPGWLRLELGRDEFFWGPGHTGSLMLGDAAPSLDQVQLCLRHKSVRYVTCFALLSPWNGKLRFLSAQRLEWAPFHWISLGAAMMDVAALNPDRPLALGDLINPLIPGYVRHTNSGQEDNFLIGGDAVVYVPQGKVYGQLFLDNYEFNDWNHAPNAMGIQAGGYWASPDVPVEARLEYSRLTSFTYYHRVHDIMYENFLVPLGHPLGPDADQVFGSVRVTPLKRLRVELVGTYTRRGYHNRGDLARRTFEPADSLPVEFPSRGLNADGEPMAEDWDVDHTLGIGPVLHWQPVYDMRVLGQVSYVISRNALGIPGADAGDWELSLGFEYHY